MITEFKMNVKTGEYSIKGRVPVNPDGKLACGPSSTGKSINIEYHAAPTTEAYDGLPITAVVSLRTPMPVGR